MPTFQDFLAQLDAAGIQIAGRETFVATADNASNWPRVVTDMARQGAKLGIRLSRPAINPPTDADLFRLAQGYPFTDEQRTMLVNNILPAT